jgi:hypothetical protein
MLIVRRELEADTNRQTSSSGSREIPLSTLSVQLREEEGAQKNKATKHFIFTAKPRPRKKSIDRRQSIPLQPHPASDKS